MSLVKIAVFYVAYLPELAAGPTKKYVVLTLESKIFLGCQISVYLYFLTYNKFIGFCTFSMISRKLVM